MPTIARVVRNTPIPVLRRYFKERLDKGERLINWQGSDAAVTRRILAAFSDFDPECQAIVAIDFHTLFSAPKACSVSKPCTFSTPFPLAGWRPEPVSGGAGPPPGPNPLL